MQAEVSLVWWPITSTTGEWYWSDGGGCS